MRRICVQHPVGAEVMESGVLRWDPRKIETERKGMGKNGISALQLCGLLRVVEEDYFLQTAMPLILAKLSRQKTSAWAFLAFPCICNHK